MMTSYHSRKETGGKLGTRSRHFSQISITDPTHHVTEAIGKLYGDEDDSDHEDRQPLSFTGDCSHHGQNWLSTHPPQRGEASPESQIELCEQVISSIRGESQSSKQVPSPEKTRAITARSLASLPNNTNAEHGSSSPASPTLSLRDIRTEHNELTFPLKNIDIPSDVALELSNLQALRRLSMDVGNHIDPDMPPLGLPAITAVSSSRDDENDSSSLLWVPARIHPELAPTEFKSFLEKRLQSIRRRSRESALSSETDPNQSVSTPKIGRQKSMLSRQIERFDHNASASPVEDATLQRNLSNGLLPQPDLSLEELMSDPTRAVRKFTQGDREISSIIEDKSDDIPILPMVPGLGLRRSTRTTYRKGGSLRSEERGPRSRKHVARLRGMDDPENENSRIPEAPRVQSFSNPDDHSKSALSNSRKEQPLRNDCRAHVEALSLQSAYKLHSTSSSSQRDELPVRTSSAKTVTTATDPNPLAKAEPTANRYFPKRTSSQTVGDSYGRPMGSVGGLPSQPSQPYHGIQKPLQISTSLKRFTLMGSETLNNTLASPSSSSGSDAFRTDNLTFIPTIAQIDKKPERKCRRDREDETLSSSSRSGGAWKWFKGVADEKDKKREDMKRSKTKAVSEQRLDNTKGEASQRVADKSDPSACESYVFNRDCLVRKVVEEGKKDSLRRSDVKRGKDGRLFSSIFGGSRKKEEKEKVSKRNVLLQYPELSHHKPMQPDVDYHWTRFPLLEERAIYRMAHIKLANPRRSLLSQVLLSNFMYNYLAIVQAMHPQMNVPISPQQKRLDSEAHQKEQGQKLAAQQHIPDDVRSEDTFDQYDSSYHRATVQYSDAKANGQVKYVENISIREHELPSNNHHDQSKRPIRESLW